MIYIYLDKETNTAEAYGSLVALCKAKGMRIDKFYSHFGRVPKEMEYENLIYKIVKTEINRSTKS